MCNMPERIGGTAVQDRLMPQFICVGT